jgi:hypothetical protein
MHDHWLAICAAFAGRIGYLPESLILYRQHSLNLVGSPKRQLLHAARKPWLTVLKLRKSLDDKGAQTEMLSQRLSERGITADQKPLQEIALAMTQRRPVQLWSLIKNRVFNLDPLRFILTCLAYLLTGCLA